MLLNVWYLWGLPAFVVFGLPTQAKLFIVCWVAGWPRVVVLGALLQAFLPSPAGLSCQ